MIVDFKIHENNLSCIKSSLKFGFHENLNEIGLVAFPLVLGLYIDDDDKKIETLRQKAFKTIAFNLCSGLREPKNWYFGWKLNIDFLLSQ